MNINGFELKLTSNACPEQYDVFKNNKKVGYLRLRYGYFYAEYLYSDGKKVYEANTNGDGLFNEDERETHLINAVSAISKQMYKDNLMPI